jgi:drug/metabolite transporter (DMT)-like permease
VAVLLGIVFAGEHIGVEECLAMAVIISAVVLIGLPQWRKQPALEQQPELKQEQAGSVRTG